MVYQLRGLSGIAQRVAAIADAHGQLDHKNWESSAASWCKSQWLTDCRSCSDSLHKPVAKGIDKRLGIELASLRQFLWRRRFNDLPDRRLLEELAIEEAIGKKTDGLFDKMNYLGTEFAPDTTPTTFNLFPKVGNSREKVIEFFSVAMRVLTSPRPSTHHLAINHIETRLDTV